MTETSKAAAISIADTAAQLRAMVLKAIVDAGQAGLTCDELEERLEMRHQTVSPRVNELWEAGEIGDSGQRRVTRSNRKAIVWVTWDLAPAAESQNSAAPSSVGKNLPVGAVDYRIVYADPAWEYKNKGRGAAANHYDEMTVEEICALPVGQLAPNSVLFIWGTWPNLPACMRVIDAWGFTFKTCGFTWFKYHEGSGKECVGGGFWTRANTEFCLIAVRGKYPKRISKKIRQIIESEPEFVLKAPRGEHSAKPAEARKRIEELMGTNLARIELFARERVAGWDAWGDDKNLGGSDVQLLPEVMEVELVTEEVTEEKEVPQQTAGQLYEAAALAERQQVFDFFEEVQPNTQNANATANHGETEMANLPADMSQEVGKARTAGGGSFIQHGDYVWMIKRWFYQKIQDRCIILEVIAIEARKKVVYEGDKKVEDEPNEVGSEASDVANFDGDGKLSAPGNARAPVLALFGFVEGSVKDDLVSGTLDEVVGEKQPAAGMLIGCSTFPKEIRSRKGTYIVGRNWTHIAKPGQGVNAADNVRARLEALKTGPQALIKLATEQLAKARSQGTAPALVDASASTIATAPPASAPEIPVVPGLPEIPPAGITREKLFADGWKTHPSDASYMYRGKEIKLEKDLLAGQ